MKRTVSLFKYGGGVIVLRVVIAIYKNFFFSSKLRRHVVVSILIPILYLPNIIPLVQKKINLFSSNLGPHLEFPFNLILHCPNFAYIETDLN